MQTFVNFIKEYGSIIIAALSVIVGIVAILVKKRPKTLDEFCSIVNEVLSDVPYMVSIQECRYGAGHGNEKKTAVLVEAMHQITSKLGRKLSSEESDACLSKVSSMVEEVLDAPEKKKKKGVE